MRSQTFERGWMLNNLASDIYVFLGNDNTLTNMLRMFFSGILRIIVADFTAAFNVFEQAENIRICVAEVYLCLWTEPV